MASVFKHIGTPIELSAMADKIPLVLVDRLQQNDVLEMGIRV